MKLQLSKSLMFALIAMSIAGVASAQIIQETVPGGELELEWVGGYGMPLTMEGAILESGNVGYGNPSGDNTVAVLTNHPPSMGGLGMAMTDPGDVSDYVFEAYFNTSDGSSRRGLLFRANPDNYFGSAYQFVLEPGLLQLKFRKLANHGADELADWFTTTSPGGLPGENEWHHLKVEANGPNFRFWFDGYELTEGTPLVDTDLMTGWVGLYNFRYDIGGIPVLFDDILLSDVEPISTVDQTWDNVKSLYR